MVKMLLENGAKADVKNKDDELPRDVTKTARIKALLAGKISITFDIFILGVFLSNSHLILESNKRNDDDE